jgi:hypothetical protein
MESDAQSIPATIKMRRSLILCEAAVGVGGIGPPA